MDILGTHGITGLDGAAFQLVPAGRIPRLAIRDTGDTTDLEFIAGGLTKYVLKNFRVYYSDSSDVIQVLEFPIELLNSGSFEWGQFQYGGEYIPISKFRVLYSDGTTQYLAADIAFADITLPLVLAKNSLGTTLASGEVDEVLNLPDVIHTDSDGTPVPTPCGVAFVATPCGGGGNVTIYYSDGSTIVISVAPGGSYTIAKHNIYRENAAGVPELVIAQEFDEDHTVPRLAIRSTDGGTVLYYLAGETATEDLPQVRIDYDFYDESGVGSQLISLDVIGLDTGELTLSDRMQRIAVLCSNAVNFLFWMDVRANREATSGGTYLGYRALIQPKVRIEYHRAGDNAIQTLLDADIDSYLPMPSDVYHLGAPAEIPRITIFYSDGVTVYVYLDITLPNHTLPQVVVKNSLGTTVDFGEVDEILAAPDASWTLKDTLANVLNSGAIASGSSADIEAPDATYSVKNSESTELAAGSIVSGGTDTVLLADITLYDSDGAELSKPAGVDVTCTVWQDVVSVKTWAEIEAVLSPAQITAAQASICAVPSGILYRFGYTLWSGESASFGAGSEGNLFSSGWYDFTPPAYPASFARLDPGAVNPWKTLLDSNVFGNLNRFTDTAGGQTYADNLVIDHLTGLMFYRVLGSAATWATALSNAEASTQGGFTDWHLPSEKILMMLLDYGRGTSLLNYLPFSISGDSWTSTTRPDSTTAARCFRSATASNIVNLTKTSTLTYILCRKHYV